MGRYNQYNPQLMGKLGNFTNNSTNLNELWTSLNLENTPSSTIYNAPAAYTPNWNSSDSVYLNNNFAGNTGSDVLANSGFTNGFSGTYDNQSKLERTGFSGNYTPHTGSTGFAKGNIDIYSMGINNTRIENYNSGTAASAGGSTASAGDSSTVKGNNNYSYEIDPKTGCITYKDPNGKKITVTEMRKHAPDMVNNAIAQSKKIQSQNDNNKKSS